MIKKTIFFNYIGSISVILTPIIFLPWYLNLLGATQFGIITFILTLQALLNLLDAGLSQAFTREIALRFDNNKGNKLKTAYLFFSLERIYWLTSISLGIILMLSASSISSNWIKSDQISTSIIQQAIYGGAIIFIFSFPGSVYRSLLIGTQTQVTLNIIISISVWTKHIGAIVILNYNPTINSYLIWHIIITIIEILVRAIFSWRKIGIERKSITWDVKELSIVWRSATTMFIAVLLGSITIQIDKIILSKMISVEQFGYYVIASTVAIGFLQLFYPILQAVLPKLIEFKNNREKTKELNVKMFKTMTVILIFLSLLLLTTGENLLSFWLQSDDSAKIIYPVLELLFIGTCLNAIYNIGYINWLSKGKSSTILKVNLISLIIAITTIPFLISLYGMIGATLGWIAINFVGLAFQFFSIFYHQKK